MRRNSCSRFCNSDRHQKETRMTAHAFRVFVAAASLALLAPLGVCAESLQRSPAVPTLDCTYNSRPKDQTVTNERCAWIDQIGQLHVTPWTLRQLSYDKHGLSTIHVKQWYYVR